MNDEPTRWWMYVAVWLSEEWDAAAAVVVCGLLLWWWWPKG